MTENYVNESLQFALQAIRDEATKPLHVEIEALRARVAELERVAAGVIRCNDRGCKYPKPIRCPAQCQADQALRAVLRLAANKPPDNAPASRPHVESPDCWCKPTLDYRDAETGREHWVHHEPN